MERDTARDLTHTYCKPSWPLSVTKTLKTMGSECQRVVHRHNSCFNTERSCQNMAASLFFFVCFAGIQCDFCTSRPVKKSL